MTHAYSGSNRIPLQPWQMEPFYGCRSGFYAPVSLRTPHIWTPNRLDSLKAFAAEGLSSYQISRRFHFTQNAVLKACQRYGVRLGRAG